jgi:phage gp29-like protein
MRYAVHEIVWKPSANGLSAEFRFVPLQFFERITGKLRFLTSDLAMKGIPLEQGGWLVTVGDGLMRATAIAYMFKTMPLKSWVSFCEKYGIPGLHGTTSAAKDTPEWEAMADALAHFGEDLALLTNEGAKITPITVSQSGSQPHQPLVDRMDRAISRIWLGGDLATMSQGEGAGSNAQTPDLDILAEHDASHVSDTLNYYVDTEVIRLRTGATKPLAYFQLIPKPRLAVDRDVGRIDAAQRFGIAISQKYVRQVLALPEPLEGEELLSAAAPSPARSSRATDTSGGG